MPDKKTAALFRKLCSKAGQTIYQNTLISRHDKVAVGLSGGKDSFLLLEILARLRSKMPEKFDLMAMHVHIPEIGYAGDEKKLSRFCEELEVPFHLLELSVDLRSGKGEKKPCFVCSWARRKKLFEATRQMKCNKLALGHHSDDALETMLMNMIWHGSISSMPYKLTMFNGRLQLIRPMLDLQEQQIIEYSTIRSYPELRKNCPFADDTKRKVASDILKRMEKLNKNARINLFRSMNNICKEYLPNGLDSIIHDQPTSPEIKIIHDI